VIRKGFRLFLAGHPDIEVVGEADSGARAVEQVRRLDPDVVLMDIRMPGGDGLEATRRIRGLEQPNRPRVIVVTTFDMDEYLFRALDDGASGFLLKDTDPDDLARAVVEVAGGGTAISPALTSRLVREFTRRQRSMVPRPTTTHTLTSRELEIVALLARGLSNQAIAEKLHVETSTVKSHVGNISAKTDASNRVQIVIWAYQNGLVSTGEHPPVTTPVSPTTDEVQPRWTT
jgi:DNA-binding NarL/FixJ family response regulator